MTTDRELAYERCSRHVLHFYRPSEAPGLRPATEKLVAMTIAWEADEDGALPPLDIGYLAERSRLSIRTFRKYLDVLFDIEWLMMNKTSDGKAGVCIDPKWLQNLPPIKG